MRWIRIAVVVAVAVGVTWAVVPRDAVCPPPVAAIVVEAAKVAQDEPPVVPVPAVREARSGRDPFAYVVQAAPPVIAQRVEPAVVAVVEERAATEVAAVQTLPRFDYRYIGRFGTAHDPIAAFVRDGDVITVRRGDTIDGRFVVKAIGANDVEIGFVNQEATLRLSLDGWI